MPRGRPRKASLLRRNSSLVGVAWKGCKLATAAAVDRDRLTGLKTRARFERELTEALEAAQAQPAGLSLAIVDIDLFGEINRAHGEALGDRLLHEVAEMLPGALGGAHAVYRFGGDAFAVVLAGVEKEQAFLELEAVRRLFETPRQMRLGAAVAPVHATVSVGLAAYPDDAEKSETLVNKACEALYRAKVSGRNKVCLSREEKMVTKTSHYTQGQLLGLRRLAERERIGEAVLLREALNTLLRKYNA